ncbi:PLP-dependent aminotransferase family protein [Priestia megaterium]|jgi:2-aminoadipate transaminase|uniref:aminotransferase-like domain-containing protein n=1 Tax=Priestia megaterium TaxID=1404 RepID=UPI00101C0F5E|nr:PLP-dependent aminotransferase family protein [Priestia megaterium]MCT9855098.1 PLP-dependent aminotransferase family protein [Priestia megaterium]MDF1960185.1 PLP-dependent aminotransferase family protein [Priestia megaterium]QSX18886.1 PLP-dependent aminotransferase family protein [Priestia megaterium]USL22921.1 PLP-dependent aminotransferase family protein [Priestia megaterium]USL40790.1 PLP-dependent aminotransferase family protein [Priestia megaterium]
MKDKFAQRASLVKSSETREILKVTERPEVISFAGGLPAPELFPVEAMNDACRAVLNEDGAASLQYSTTEGYIPLREAISKRMQHIGIESTVSNILITSGSQQAIDLTGRLFLNDGDVVICESPTYLAAINVFKSYNATFVEVDMDEDGMIMEELEKKLQENPHAKFIYTIPDFQNPTGRTLTRERRQRMIELANAYDVLIVEDNPYGGVRFAGETLPPVKHFDTEGRVIYISTFSKIFAPGLRIGWVCADEAFIDKYVAFKQVADLHTDSFAQRVTAKYMELYDIEEHIQKIKAVYKERCTQMLSCIEEFFPENLSYSKPEGGLFIWVELPQGIDSAHIFSECLKNNVACVPGTPFFPNGTRNNALRLNYSNMSAEQIVEGMKRMGDVLHRELTRETTVL